MFFTYLHSQINSYFVLSEVYLAHKIVTNVNGCHQGLGAWEFPLALNSLLDPWLL